MGGKLGGQIDAHRCRLDPPYSFFPWSAVELVFEGPRHVRSVDASRDSITMIKSMQAARVMAVDIFAGSVVHHARASLYTCDAFQ